MIKILFVLLGVIVLNEADGTFTHVSTDDLSNFDEGKEVEVPYIAEEPYGNDVALQKRSNSDKLMRRSNLDRNFIRFGRSGFRSETCCKDKDSAELPEVFDSSNSEHASLGMYKKQNSKPFGRGVEDNFIRFGRDDNFMRFGRGDSFMRFGRGDKDNFMRFGRGDKDNFMRFGRGDKDNFMRFGRGDKDNFMRFGRGDKDSNFIRFGRGDKDSNFIRFGRGDKDNNFMRFGRGDKDNFMRFGRNHGEDSVQMSRENFFRSIKNDNFMRFGRSSKSDGKDTGFIRFGRNGNNFLRFGRGTSEEAQKVDESVDAESDSSENSLVARRKRMTHEDADHTGNNKVALEIPKKLSI